MSQQQHFLTNRAQYQELLSTLPLAGRHILDIGMGHGEVTEMLLQAGAEKVTGFEIDPGLPSIDDPRVNVVIGDIREHEHHIPRGVAVVSNPPYKLFPYLWNLFVRKEISDIVIMIPERHPIPSGFVVEFSLPGLFFHPASKGIHHVIRAGWND